MSTQSRSGAFGADRVRVPRKTLEANMDNLAELVSRAARRGPHHPALIDTGGGADAELTWSALDALVTAQAGQLIDAGLSNGDRVALKLPTSSAFGVAFFGALRAGCTVVPVASTVLDAELDAMIADSGARMLITDGPSSDPIPALAPVTSADSTDRVIGKPPRLAVLAYTSGTSGPARAAMLSHEALLANVEQCASLRPTPITAADRVLLALPLFHTYGLGPGLLQVAAAGATAVLMPRFEAESALDVIERHRVTNIVGVPPMYYAWLRLPHERLRTAMATVRLLSSGAAPLEPEALAALRAATGLTVFEGYGLTETGPVLTTTLASAAVKPGSVGSPLPRVEIRLVDADGVSVDLPEQDDEEPDVEGSGETGLVAARGPNLFDGYWPDGRHGPDEDGWFRTGDVGYLDGDGDLHLVDRASDLIIVNGFNVYPHEVENVLLGMPEIFEVAAVGIPDSESGEAVKAYIVLTPGAKLTAEDVQTYCGERIAKFKVPVVVEFLDELPHSPTGKITRRSLRGAQREST